MPDWKITFGPKHHDAGYAFEIEQYPSFQAMLVLSGELVLTAEGRDHVANAGDVIVLPLYSNFTLHSSKSGYEAWGVTLWGDHMPGYDEGRPCVVKSDRLIRDLHKTMKTEIAEKHSHYWVVCEGLAVAFARSAQKLGARASSGKKRVHSSKEWADDACAILDINVYSGAPTKPLLAGLGITYRQLCRHFQTVLRMSPKQYYLRRRVSTACRFLEESDMNVNSIATELGFYSAQHFATQFRNLLGSSPTEYRRRHLEAVKKRAARA